MRKKAIENKVDRITKKNVTDSKNDKIYFLIILPIIFIAMIFIYMTVDKLSASNSKVCTYLGKLWIAASPTNPNELNGCYTYEELARMGKL